MVTRQRFVPGRDGTGPRQKHQNEGMIFVSVQDIGSHIHDLSGKLCGDCLFQVSNQWCSIFGQHTNEYYYFYSFVLTNSLPGEFNNQHALVNLNCNLKKVK